MPRLLIAAVALLLAGCATVEPGTPRAASGISADGERPSDSDLQARWWTWAWIPPLSAGEHELRIEGASGGFATSARYRLTAGAAD